MRAAVVHEYGGPEVLSFEDAPKPQPGPGQILAKVSVAAVNPIDWKFRRGLMPKELPAILGIDFAGVVEESQTEAFGPGDAVFGRASSGAYAEYVVAEAGAVARMPPGLADEQAAALPVVGLTAWQSLFEVGGLERGQRVLIAGAAGGVGHLAVQFAKHAGAHVLATGSPSSRDFVLGLGADEFIDYRSQDVSATAKEIDLALDYVGAATTATLVPTLKAGGLLVTIANAPPQDAAAERGARAVFFSSHPDGEQLAEIAELVAGGVVRIEIAEVMPFADLRRAHELSESGRVSGKLLVRL